MIWFLLCTKNKYITTGVGHRFQKRYFAQRGGSLCSLHLASRVVKTPDARPPVPRVDSSRASAHLVGVAQERTEATALDVIRDAQQVPATSDECCEEQARAQVQSWQSKGASAGLFMTFHRE